MKKYRPSKKQIRDDHDAFRKRGVHPEQLAKKHKAAIPFPDYKTNIVTAPTSDKVGMASSSLIKGTLEQEFMLGGL